MKASPLKHKISITHLSKCTKIYVCWGFAPEHRPIWNSLQTLYKFRGVAVRERESREKERNGMMEMEGNGDCAMGVRE